MPEQARPPPPPIRPFSWSRTVTIFMVLLTLMVLIDPNLSRGLGLATAAALNPLFGFGGRYPVVTIFFAAMLTTGISTLLRHFFSDWIKLARFQKQQSAISKASMEALRRGNMNKVQKLRETGTKLRADNMSVQFQPLKTMAFTFLLFILVFSWLNEFMSGQVSSEGTMLYAVPWQFQTSLFASYLFASWLLLYMLFNIFLSQFFTRILKFFSFRRKLAGLTQGSKTA